MAIPFVGHTDREDDIILYYNSEEDAIAARREWYKLDEQDDPHPPVFGSLNKPGKWYWVCRK